MDLHVLIAIPHRGDMHSKFVFCLIDMINFFNQRKVPGYARQKIQPFGVLGSVLSKSRWMCVQEAQRLGASHLLFLDSDQTFPATTLHRLVMADKGVVAANIATKQIPSTPTARRASAELGGDKVFTDANSKGFEEVWRVGTGVMLLRRDVFSQIRGQDFEVRYKPEVDDLQGEDWTLCERLNELNIPIWVDHDLSWHIGHVGNFEYTHDVVGEVAPQ